VCGMQALDARGARTARAVQAETLAWLAEAGQRLAQLRDLHGRQPREGEWGLILDGPARSAGGSQQVPDQSAGGGDG